MTTSARSQPPASGCVTLDHCALLEAAARADEEAVALALRTGADVNTLDATSRTVISCAIGGECWDDADVSDASYMLQTRLRILRLLLSHHDISLYALNVPVRGVTPLGLAAWLNVPDVVRLLVEGSDGMVAVDGIDAHAATPLMYAARDSRREVVCHLLEHDARPDRRDMNHRSSIQYALRHPEILGVCEFALRRHRAREYLPSNRRNLSNLPEPFHGQLLVHNSANLFDGDSAWLRTQCASFHQSEALLQAVACADLSSIHSLLFPIAPFPSVAGPSEAWSLPLVNLPDSAGWSLMHYCVAAERPSIGVLDALYLAGADLSLYASRGHGTPLHCLAKKARPSQDDDHGSFLRSFVHHLVRDLGAPLAARDHNNDTCLHVAAEHGQSVDVLVALLACDPNGSVRELRNSRGLTALDVARAEFRVVFGMDAEHVRCVSSASARTIRPSNRPSLRSMPSLASIASATFQSRSGYEKMHDLTSPDTYMSALPQRILDNLHSSSQALVDLSALDVNSCRELLLRTFEMGEDLLAHLRSRIHDAAAELRDARGTFRQVDGLLEDVSRCLEDVDGEFFVEGVEADTSDRPRRRTTDSGDSEATAVSNGGTPLPRKSHSMSDLKAGNLVAIHKEWPAPSFPTVVTCTADASSSDIVDVTISVDGEDKGLLKLMPPWLKDLPRKRSKSDVRASTVPEQLRMPVLHRDRKDSARSSTAKIRAWLRKKLKSDVPAAKPTRAFDMNSQTSTVDLSRSNSSVSSTRPVQSTDVGRPALDDANRNTVLSCRTCLNVAGKDMSRIEDCMDTADQFISLAYRSLAQAERSLSAAILDRKASLECARLSQLNDHSQDRENVAGVTSRAVDFPYMTSHCANGETQQSTPSSSANSSIISLSATLIDTDDDDLRALRRLLGRKIEARTDGAFEEIDRVVVWLRIVRDALRGLRRRTTSDLL